VNDNVKNLAAVDLVVVAVVCDDDDVEVEVEVDHCHQAFDSYDLSLHTD
jgi:hypothetical protein